MVNKRNNLVFFGNWGIGFKSLKKLLNDQIKCETVVTQYDVNSENEYFNLVHDYAIENGISIAKNSKDLLAGNNNVKDCIGISVAYREIFSEDTLRKMKIVNFHPSLLPDFRGPAPIEWQLKSAQRYIGVTAHLVDGGIDTGDIIEKEKFPINYRWKFDGFLEKFNEFFSEFILRTTKKILKVGTASINYQSQTRDSKDYYRPRITIPQVLRRQNLEYICNFLNRKRIAFFTGSRAEFGTLFPLLAQLSEKFYVDVFVSGGHVLHPWNTIEDIRKTIDKFKMPVDIIPLRLNGLKNSYTESLGYVYSQALKFLEKCKDNFPYEFGIVLGDRIETYGFVLASFFSKLPIVHIAGGDIANVPYFDTNVRHSVSKLAHIHLTTNEKSSGVLSQIGEEDWRIVNIGVLSYDYDRLNMLPSKSLLAEELNLTDSEFYILLTFHASHMKSAQQNLEDFQTVVEAVRNTGLKSILSYPNNDPGSELLIPYIQNLEFSQQINIIPNLGTARLLALFKYFKVVVVGNSSSGLMETAFYCVPALNIGDRQTDRFRAGNVFDVPLDEGSIRDTLLYCVENYETLKVKFAGDRLFFGDGTASVKAKDIISELLNMSREKILFKKFILSESPQNESDSSFSTSRR